MMKVELSEAFWTVVMEQLSEGSIKKCLPIFQEIARQLRQKPTEEANTDG